MPAAVAALISGAAWLAWEVSRRLWDDGASSDCSGSAGYFNDLTFAVANLSAGVALLCVSALLRPPLRALAMVAAAGAAAIGVGNGLEHCVAEPFFIPYVAGSLAFVLASIVLAAGMFVRGELGRWPGLLLALAAAGLMIGAERGGAAMTAAAWIAFGAWLMVSGERSRNMQAAAE